MMRMRVPMGHVRRRDQRGYTAVEVLSALTLLAIGAAGVIGMQRVTLQGSEDARRYDMGTNIANEWCSRLQRDATQWTEPNANVSTSNRALTKFLSTVGATGAPPPWTTPPASAAPAGMTGSFDIFGRDEVVTSTTSTYCAQYRLQWIADPGLAPPFNPMALIRGEVRVFWSRLEQNPIGNCAAATPDAANANQIYHFVYATTAIRENAFRE